MAENGTKTGEITPQQQRAISALLSTRTVTEAATRAKVGERTLWRWLNDPTFKAHLTAAESDLIDHATRRLLQYQDAAISVIATIMADKENPASVRLRAAGMVVDTMMRLRELRDIEARISALEKAYAEGHHETA